MKSEIKSDQEILNEFGRILVKKCFDEQLEGIIHLRKVHSTQEPRSPFIQLIQKLDEDDFKILMQLLHTYFGGNLFSLLTIFEEEDRFKLFYKSDDSEEAGRNLQYMSDFLPVEIAKDNGWIEMFSKFNEFKTE